MTNPAPEGGTLAKFFAKKVIEGFPGTKDAAKAAVSEIELANRISEIVIETQTAGSSYLKVHIIDPELTLATSGWLNVKEGLLEPIEVEFPEASKWHWVLCAVEGSTNVTDANLVCTFEDRIVYFMRQYFGVTHTPSGVSTRAQFIRKLVAEIGSRGEAKAGFVCPSINTPQPIETETQAESKKTHTALDQQEKEEMQTKKGGLGSGSIKIEGVAATRRQAADISTAFQKAAELKAPALAVEAMIVAGIGESGFHQESTNASGHMGIWQSSTIPGNEVAKQAEFFLKGGESFQHGGAIKSAQEKLPPGEIATLVEASGEPASFYEKHIANAREIIAQWGGITGNVAGSTEESAVSDVGILQRGTPANPDEDSFECAVRLANQVLWFFFSDNHNFFYMDGPDLKKQKPALYVDVPKNHIRFPNGQTHDGVIHSPTTFHFDNVTFEYRFSHKVRPRAQRKAKTVRPSSPAEIKLLLECDIEQFHAGQVFHFKNSGPMGAGEIGEKWIITNTRRECLKNNFTEIILEPPIEPLPEPRSTGGTEEIENNNPTGNAGSGSALAAFNASSALSEMQIPYSYGGGHGSNQLTEVKAGFLPGLDCSSSTCWVLHTAGMFPSSTAQTSGELQNFGEPGQGKEMTIWAGPNHVYIEFNVSGHEPAQMNTNGTQNGPRLYSTNKNPTYNGAGGAGSGGPFVARHFKGT